MKLIKTLLFFIVASSCYSQQGGATTEQLFQDVKDKMSAIIPDGYAVRVEGGDFVPINIDSLIDLTFEWSFQDTSINVRTANTFQTIMNTDTPVLTAGTYLVQVGYAFNSDAGTSDFIGQFLIDGISRGSATRTHQQEAKDAANGPLGAVAGTGSGQIYSYSKPFLFDITVDRTVNFQFNYRTEAAGVESSFWDFNLHLTKISN